MYLSHAWIGGLHAIKGREDLFYFKVLQVLKRECGLGRMV
jgi:hypothetical protein